MHARNYAPGYKNVFPYPVRSGSSISLSSNRGRSSNEMVATSMLISTAQCQKLVLIFNTLKLLVFRRSMSLGHVVHVTAHVNDMLYFVLAT